MSKISCGLSIDMLAPYIEDVLVDNPIIGGENGVPLTEVYRQTLMDLEDVIDDFRASVKNISQGIPTDYTELIQNLIPASIDMQHSIKKAKDEAYELNVFTSLKVFRESMNSAINSLVQEWDDAIETAGTSGTSLKDTELEQSDMPDGDDPVGNADVATRYIPPSRDWSKTELSKKDHMSMDRIIQEALGFELIEKAPQLMDLLKDVIGHSVADTRVSSSGIRFTMNRQKIRSEIESKLREAVTVYYENNAVGIGTSEPIGRNISSMEGNTLLLTNEQLPEDIKTIKVEDSFALYYSKNIVDKNGKAKMLLVGDPKAAGIDNITPMSSINLPLDRESVIKANSEAITNAYLAKVLLNNFNSMIDNTVPYLRESHIEKKRIGSVDITDTLSGNQAKAITRTNITTTPKLAPQSKTTLSNTINKLKAEIRDRGDGKVTDILKGILDTLVGESPVTRIRMNDDSFEDVITVKINNRRYPLVLQKDTTDPKNVTKFWGIVTNVDPKLGIEFATSKTDPRFREEASLLSLMNSLFEIDRIAEARDLSDMKVSEVPVESVFSTLNSITASLLDSKKGLKIYEVAEDSNNIFLSETEIESLSSIFINLPQDLDEAGKYLGDIVETSHGAEGDILRGLYNRFFNPSEYYITRKNPITGKKETQKHNSFYRIAKTVGGKQSLQALDQLVALKQMLNTIAPNEFINMINGSSVLSNTLSGDTLANNFDTIDFTGTVRIGQYYFTEDSLLSKFKIAATSDPNQVKITFKPGSKQKSFIVKVNSGSYGGASFSNFPFTMEDDGGLSLADFKVILESLKLPGKFATQEFLSLTGATGKDQRDLKDFIGTMISLKLSNGNKNGRNFQKMIGRKPQNANLLSKHLINRKVVNNATYPISEHLPRHYKDYLKNVLDKFEGLSIRKFVVDHNFNKRMTTATVNKALRLAQIVKEAKEFGNKNLYSESAFVLGKLTIDGVYSKNGIIEGFDGKSNSALSTTEQFRFLVESAFLDTAEQKNFMQAAFQTSTKSDRGTISLPLVGRTGGDSFLPKATDDTFDRETLIKDVLESQKTFYSAMDRKILDEWLGEGTKYGKGFLQRIYDRDVQMTNIYGDQVVISKDALDKVQTVRDLSELLEELQLDFTEVRKLSGISANLGFDRFDADEETAFVHHNNAYLEALGESKFTGSEELSDEDLVIQEELHNKYNVKGKKIAGIRSSTIRMSEIMQDSKAAEDFIHKNRLIFEKSVNKLFNGNYKLSHKAYNTIENRFGEMSEKAAKSILLDAFFYNDILISNELSRFETGPIEQYKNQGQKSLLDEVYGQPASKVISHVKGLIGKQTYEDLAGDTRLGVAKRIIEDPIMDLRDKVALLEFDDLSSQLSPAYVEQVKRNQGVGTSLQMFTKANPNKGGAFVGNSTKNITIDDPSADVYLLGKSGPESVDVYDATLIMLPGEMIKYNNSLGNRMSNFSSKGGAFKDANVSSTEDGYYVYQKKASQPLFGAEFLINATPEHLRLYNNLTTRIKWDNTPLYVENVTNESIGPLDSAIDYNRLQRYGESLGELKTINGESVHADALLFKLDNKEITPDEINALGLTTDKVLKSFDSIRDLLDHFGGIEGDYNRLKTNPDERSEYTFGYSWHQAIDVISNYRGGEDASYPLRDAYIGKVGFTSQEKTGNRSVNPASSLTDGSELVYEEIPNSDSGIILQPDHNPDTTASMNSRKDDEHDSDIKVITQILSASVGEGEGFENVREILNTVGAVVDMEMSEFEAEIEEFGAKYKKNFPDATEEEIKHAGYLNVAYQLAKTSLQTRNDPGITGSMIFDSDPNDVNFDHKAVLPVLRTAVNAELNKRTVNLRFKGNQTVVTASHDQVKSYTFGTSQGVFRSTVNNMADKLLSNNLDLPAGWELNPVNKFDNLSDTDYVYEVKDDGTRIRTTFGKFRQMINTNGRTFTSVFSPKNNGPKEGQVLQWFNYRTADGSQNLKDTLEFKRYMTAPSFFGMVKKTGAKEALLAFPEYTPRFAELATEVNNQKEFITEIAKDLHDVLQVPGKWVTDEAEFYVPPMHQAAFLIDDFDTLHDIIGTGPQPDTKGLLNLGLITKREFEILERKASHSEGLAILQRLKESGNDLAKQFVLAKEAQTRAMFEYFGGTDSTDGKVKKEIKEFKQLLLKQKLGKIKQSEDKRLSTMLGSHPILGLLVGELSPKSAMDKIANIISKNSKLSTTQLNLLLDMKAQIEKVSTAAETDAIIEKTINNKYVNTWIQTLVDNFPYTLTFISARIPASGKQSYVAAKVKNFIFSTRNASYGPLELIGISGADYDIDKQNNLTWDVDIYGKVYDWLEYEDGNGKLLPTKAIKSKINKEVDAYRKSIESLVDPESLEEIVASYRKSKIDEMSRRLQNRVVRGLITNITDPKNAIEAATAVAMSKLKGIKKRLAEYNYGQMDDDIIFKRAFKDDSEVKGLLAAIESTGDLSEDLKILKKSLDKGHLKKYADSAISLLMEPRKHALPLSSLTKMIYERVNLDGKTGIGIFASALKGYFGSYYAWVGNAGLVEYRRIVDEMRDSGELAKFPSIGEANDEIIRKLSPAGKKEMEKLQFSTPYISRNKKGNISNDSTLKADDIKILGDDFNPDALQIVSQNEDGTFKMENITTLANTGKWNVKGYVATANARTAAELVKAATSVEEENEIIGKFIADREMFRNFNVESQAWADLSELLNAATDNAKELILGYIGATNNTDATISALVIMGVDLNDALTLLNDPIVKKVVKKIESRDDLFGRKSDFNLTLAKELASSVKRQKFDVEAFREAHSDLSKEEMSKQLVLAKLYNPSRQLSVFAKIGEELTSLSSGFFSINQGLPNSEYDVFNFIRKANKALQNGTFEEFVNDDTRRDEIIEEFQKTGLNVPYIIASNPHYFGQFRALTLTNEIVNSVSFISNLVRSDLLKHEGRRIDKPEYTTHTNAVYGLIVDAFYNDSENANVKITIGGKTFDLSKASQDGEVGGRLEFVRHIPDVVSDSKNDANLSDNKFIKDLFINTKSQDRETGDQMTYVLGPATDVMTPEDISITRANASKLRKTNPDLFNALFNYSLIVDRGGLSKGSLAQFFRAEDFKAYNDFVKRGGVESNLALVFDNISNESRQLMNPSLITSVSASAAYDRSKKGTEEEQEFEGGEDTAEFDRMERRARREYNYKMSWLNTDRSRKNKRFAEGKRDTPAENILRIKETGTIVAWNEQLETFLPITKATPDVSIPISIEGMKSNRTIFDVTKFGFDYGWGINVTSEFKGAKKGRLLRKTAGTRNNRYFDVLIDGQIRKMHERSIQRYNPGIVLDTYGRVDLSSVGQVADARMMHYNPNTKKITLEPTKGGDYPVEIDPSLQYVYDATDLTVFDQSFANLVVKKVGKSVDRNYALENFDKSPVVKNFRKALITSAFRLENETDNLLTDTEIDAIEDYKAKAIRREFDRLSSIDKINLLRNGQEVWEDFISKHTDNSNIKWNIGDSEFNQSKIPTKMTQLELSYITDPKLATTLTIGQTLSIVNQLGINEKVYYDKLLKTLGEDKTAYVLFDGELINGTRFLPDYVTNPRVQESKDYVVPVELNMEANQLIGAKTLKRMAKIFNNKFTNTKTQVLNSEEIRSEYGERYANLRGFVINGQIILNQDKASLSTPIHELGHIYLAYLKDEDSKLYDYIVQESLKSDIAQSIKDAYPELNNSDVGEEVFVEMLGLEFGKDLVSITSSNLSWNNIKRRLSNNKAFGKITDFFRTVIGWFTGKTVPKSVDFTLGDSLASIINQVGNSIVYGKDSIFNDFTSPEQTAMRLADPNGTLTSEELIQRLTEKGYIRKICP